MSEPASGITTRETNVRVYARHSLLTDVLARHPDLIQTAIPGTNISASGFTYGANVNGSISIGATIDVGGGVTVRFVSTWAGAPLQYRSVTATPYPSTPLTIPIAESFRNAANRELTGKYLLPEIAHAIDVKIGAQKGRFSFSSEFSAAGLSHLLLSGNGGLDLDK